jgi:uncharacterized protein YodC (DUF2158 family)
MALKRIYMPAYELELNLGGEIVQMKRDPDNEGRPYVEVTERQERLLTGAVAHVAQRPAVPPAAPPPPAALAPGQSVVLKSGGPEMKIERIAECQALCVWGDQRQEFALADLVAAAPEPVQVSAAGTETHSLNSADSKTLVAGVNDVPTLQALLAGEKAHPEFQNGRVGVIAAIENRIKELNG